MIKPSSVRMNLAWLQRFSQAVDTLSAVAGIVAAWLVLLAVLISAGNATIRYLLNVSSNGWLEIQWYMFGALVFLGASHTLKMNEHVRVDLFYSAVSNQARLWIDVVGFAIIFVPVLVTLTLLSMPFFLHSFRQGEVSNNAGGLILWPIKLVLPLGFALLLLQGLSEIVKRVGALRGEVALNAKYEKPLQ